MFVYVCICLYNCVCICLYMFVYVCIKKGSSINKRVSLGYKANLFLFVKLNNY